MCPNYINTAKELKRTFAMALGHLLTVCEHLPEIDLEGAFVFAIERAYCQLTMPLN
jgi:hypothetical protein